MSSKTKKFLFFLLFLFIITGCQVNKEASNNNEIESPPTPPNLEKNNTKLQTPPAIPIS